MSSLKSRLDKLAKRLGDGGFDPLTRALERYGEKDWRRNSPSFDRGMLLDTMIALFLKDDEDHPKFGVAQDFLAWASTTDFKLIERAEKIIKDLVAVKCFSETPAPWKATAVDSSTVQPPYPFYCTMEQLAKCPKSPLWG